MQLTELQKTQAAYAHFTLDEWKYILQCVRHHTAAHYGMSMPLSVSKVNDMLSKFPSAVL